MPASRRSKVPGRRCRFRGRFADAFLTLPTVQSHDAGDRALRARTVRLPVRRSHRCPDLPEAAFSPSLHSSSGHRASHRGAHSLLAQYLYDVLAHKKEN
jgi:hypothetical protein